MNDLRRRVDELERRLAELEAKPEPAPVTKPRPVRTTRPRKAPEAETGTG
jgi:hypothetical protein